MGVYPSLYGIRRFHKKKGGGGMWERLMYDLIWDRFLYHDREQTGRYVQKVSIDRPILCTNHLPSPLFPRQMRGWKGKGSETNLPPINHQIRACDIASRRRAAQQHHRPRQLLRIPHPARGIAARPHGARALQPRALVQHRVHVSRRDAVDADAVAGPFGREAGFQGYERGFGRVVAGLRLWVVGPVGRDGRDE